MAHDDQGAGPAVEEVLQHPKGVEVEVVGRLVEQQHVGPLGQHQQQLEAAPFSARERADGRPLGVGVEPEPLHELSVLPVRPAGRAGHGVARPAGPRSRSRPVWSYSPTRTVGPRSDLSFGWASAGRRARRAGWTCRVPLGPTMPSRPPGSRSRSRLRNSQPVPAKAWPTPSSRMTLSPSRGVARDGPRSRSGRVAPDRAGAWARPSTRAVAAATRAWGLRVRAGAPRRSQASSARARLRRTASAPAARSSRRARASRYEA